MTSSDEIPVVPEEKEAPRKTRIAKLACESCGRTIFDLEAIAITGEPMVFLLKNCREAGKVKQFREWLKDKYVRGWAEVQHVLVIDMQGDREEEIRLINEAEMKKMGWVRADRASPRRKRKEGLL